MTPKQFKKLKLGDTIEDRGILYGLDPDTPMILTVNTIRPAIPEVTFSVHYMGVPLGEVVGYILNNEVFIEGTM